jgi:hypothetical protein
MHVVGKQNRQPYSWIGHPLPECHLLFHFDRLDGAAGVSTRRVVIPARESPAARKILMSLPETQILADGLLRIG